MWWIVFSIICLLQVRTIFGNQRMHNARLYQLHQQRLASMAMQYPINNMNSRSQKFPVIGVTGSHLQNPVADFVTIENLPNKLSSNMNIKVKYQCGQLQVIGLFIEGYEDGDKLFRNSTNPLIMNDPKVIFKYAWRCNYSPQAIMKTIRLKIPRRMVCQPNILVPKVSMLEDVKLKVFMVKQNEWNYIKTHVNTLRNRLLILYDGSKIKLQRHLEVKNPLDRPRCYFNQSLSWISKTFDKILIEKPLLSPYEEECSSIVAFPIVMMEEPYGVIQGYYPYHNIELRRLKETSDNLRLTFAAELYLTSWCKKQKLCGIFQHIDSDDHFESPLILMNSLGKIHVQMKLINNQSYAFASRWSVPLHQWLRLHISQTNAMVNISLYYGKDFSDLLTHSGIFHKPVSYVDFNGYMAVGGSIYCNNFNGIISHAKFCRNKRISPEQVGYRERSHNTFDWSLQKHMKQQRVLQRAVKKRWKSYCRMSDNQKDVTVPYFLQVVQNATNKYKNKEQCPAFNITFPKRYKSIDVILWQLSQSSNQSNIIQKSSDELYKIFSNKLENSNSLQNLTSCIELLRQSAKLGHGLSHFLLYTIYKNGVGVEVNLTKAKFHLLTGAHCGDVMCLKALGYNHLYGLGGFTKDASLSFYYYFNLAHKTQKALMEHDEGLTSVNFVRLTEEKQMKQQLLEGDDLFEWIKHQATKGAFSAQRNMGRLLYWGQQGLQRNLNAAFEYYKEAAQGGDPNAMYDYGVVLIKGHGTEANAEKGVEVLKQAADHQNPGALNTLGWYYTVKEVNMTKAAEYFEQADKLGSVDAAYNLGHMYHTGKYPGKKRDVKMAFSKYYKAATGGHIESALQVSYFMATGIQGFLPRNVLSGVQWSQYITERNPTMGELIREGLQAYRRESWSKALLLYMGIAETGFEVAQYNTAFLCENNMDDLVQSNIKEDCVWKNWNASSLYRSPHPYALNKMGDYFYYGYQSDVNLEKAIAYYGYAAKLKFPQAIFNLANIMEIHGDVVDERILKSLSLPNEAFQSQDDMIVHLYKKCSDSDSVETSLPCYMALMRTQSILMWNNIDFKTKCTTLIVLIVTTLILLTVRLKRRRTSASLAIIPLDDIRTTNDSSSDETGINQINGHMESEENHTLLTSVES